MGIQTKSTKKDTCQYRIQRRERGFQKKALEILVDKHIQQEQQQQETEFTVVSLDESFFFYDSLVRRVWIEQKKRPIVRVTGSHKHIHVFLVLSVLEVSNYSDTV